MQFDLATIEAEHAAGALPEDLRRNLRTLTILAMDVDGVLTDGGRAYGPNEGLDGVTFNVRDGLGLALLARAGVRVVWISARTSEVIARRARDLRIEEVFLGVTSKRDVLEQLRATTAGRIAYIGDDLWDLAAFAAADVSVAVRDADRRVRREAMIVTRGDGGRGAVREFIDLVLDVKQIDPIALLPDVDGTPDISAQEAFAIRERTRSVYDTAAPRYVEVFGSDQSDAAWITAFAVSVRAYTTAGETARVLDVGSGPAIFTAVLRECGCDSIGLDISFSMLREGQSHAVHWTAVQADMTHLPFRPHAKVGGALIAYSLLHLPKPAAKQCLRELRSMLDVDCPLLLLLKEGDDESAWIDASLVPGERCFVSLWRMEDARALLEESGYRVDRLDRNAPQTEKEIQRAKIAFFARAC